MTMKMYIVAASAFLISFTSILLCAADQQHYLHHANIEMDRSDTEALSYYVEATDKQMEDEKTDLDNTDHDADDGPINQKAILASKLESLIDEHMQEDDSEASNGPDNDNLNQHYDSDDSAGNDDLELSNSDEVFDFDARYEGDNYSDTEIVVDQASGNPSPIIFKYVKEYAFIWNDKGSGADRDVSIWRPVDIEGGFYPLGDTANGRYGKPFIPSITVSEGVPGALSTPASYRHIWNDRGSGADRDVYFAKLIPRQGYTCLGHVAVASYRKHPDLNKYRCVKSEYVSKSDGIYDFVWNDRGSGARRDVSIYANTNIESKDGRSANTFTATATYSTAITRYQRPNLLKVSTSTEKLPALLQPQDDKAIIVYQVQLKEKIWNDAGSGADRAFLSWRAIIPEGFHSLGDYGVASHSGPHFITLVRAVKDDALRPPLDFRQRWNDRGSGANRDVAFYEPICPSGYRALGHVSVASHSRRPEKSDFRCVKAKYTARGYWRFIWNDRGSGSRRDVSVYMAQPKYGGQGLRAMSVVPCYCGMDRTAYVLNSKYTQYIVTRPVERYIIEEIQYDIDGRNILSSTPVVLANTFLVNHGSTPQSATRTVTFSYEESHSWSYTVGVELGVTVTITGKVPQVAEKSVSFSLTSKYETTTSVTFTESKQDEVSATVNIQPNSRKSAVVTANRYVVDVPYTAKMTEEYYDGTKSQPKTINGKYSGVQVNDIYVVYNQDVPLARRITHQE